MKYILIFLLVILLSFIITKHSLSQPCSDCSCGTQSNGEFDPNPSGFRGGFFKPATSNIGGATQGQDQFPVLK